ncbi:MAG: geranylgeranyl reductase [Marmoricola sp.]|nr:geranylgeranyl reductase [Marmoricola sp.]
MRRYDLAVVGAGPAGAATAIGALRADPSLSVALIDRADFPRDKTCGDGIAPHVIDLLAAAGVTDLVEDHVPVRRLRLVRRGLSVDRTMARPAWVVPRSVFDHRLVSAARSRGADLVRHRVRRVEEGASSVVLDDTFEAGVVVGADGAHSVVGRVVGVGEGPMAVAIRGYAPTRQDRAGAQVIVFGTQRQPSYAWAFDLGNGTSNVGYGEMLTRRGGRPSRALLMEQLETLLPGSTTGGHAWRGHHLPLSTWRGPRRAGGRLLLAGDAAGLVNPMTGEGIFYAVATGLHAGRAAAEALAADRGAGAARRQAELDQALLAGHLRHTDLAARLCRSGTVLDAGLRAAAADQRVFDDLVELGLARGRITATMAGGLLKAGAALLTDRSRSTDHVEET